MNAGFVLFEVIQDAKGAPADLVVLEANRGFEATTGLKAPEVIGRRLTDILPGIEKDEAGWIATYGAVALTGNPRVFEDESFLLGACYSISAFQAGPRQCGVTFVDITERKRAEEERARLQGLLAQAQKMESLGSLAGGVAHDMNNVLSAILSIAELYQARGDGDPAFQRNMETIVHACLRGRSLVQGLLGFARQGVAQDRILDLNQVVREEIALLARTTLAKVEVRTDLDGGLPRVKGDPAALSHALLNLCVNAVEAMPGGGTLTLRTRIQDGWARVEVEDDGQGMTEEVLAKALDPFFTTRAPGKGTGLGLSIVYSTVKAHRGRLEMRSEPGSGTCVTIHLPAAQGDPDVPEDAPLPAPEAQGLQVLLVDDDDLVQHSTAQLLGVLGHRVTVASRGEEGIVHLRSGLPCDLVILDMNMPGLGGAATLPELRKLRPGLQVVLATGRADQEAIDLAAAHPPAILLPKPFTMGDLRRTLAGLDGASARS
jgi:signal transduction histidine kinase